MKLKQSSLRAESSATTSSISDASSLLMIGALCALANGAFARGITPPLWVQSQLTAPLPQHDEETDAAALYSELATRVEPNGKIHRTHREVYRILRTGGERRALVRVDFNSQSRVTAMRGWAISSDGKPYEVTEKDAMESALVGVLNGELVGDVRSKIMRIPAAVPGSTIGYEVEEEIQPYVPLDEWQFQDTIPVREAHYSLELPPGWRYKATWINHAEEPAAPSGSTRWQWQVHDLKAIEQEFQMPPMRALAGRMAVWLLPPTGQQAPFQNWSEMGTWYLSLASDRRSASADIKKKVVELTTPRATQLGKMQALASFVQSDIRYVAIELGIGGLQPHSAADVFVHRYGDCKDKVTLLSAMLNEIGVESYYLIVNSRRGAITSSVPMLQDFNHVILAIRLPAKLETSTLLATHAHPKLGSLLIFDPTDPFTPLGNLSGRLQGGQGLLIAPGGGELIELPREPASANALTRTAHLQLDENGRLHGEVHEVRIGDSAAEERLHLDSTRLDSDRAKSVEALMANSFATFELTHAVVANRLETSRPLEWTYSLEVDRYARVSGDLLIVRPRVLGSKTTGFLETKEARQYDIEFEALRRDADSFEIALPAKYAVEELPPPIDEEHPFAAYHSKTELIGNTLIYSRTFELKDLAVPVTQADELKAFYRVILNDERKSAILKKPAP